jgi:hypothetical protein
MILLASSPPAWMIYAFWAVIFSPLLPGLVTLIVGLILFAKKNAATEPWFWSSLVLLGVGGYCSYRLIGWAGP